MITVFILGGSDYYFLSSCSDVRPGCDLPTVARRPAQPARHHHGVWGCARASAAASGQQPAAPIKACDQ